MDWSQIIKFLLEHLPVLAPVLPFLGLYFWLRNKQEELAEKNMTVAAAVSLLQQSNLTFTEDKVRKAFVQTVIVYHINALVIVDDNSRCEISKFVSIVNGF